ncbi:MAG: phosphoglycerate dehydrogenase, partial [Candidatus Omnitrophica bacterium]|nr:phosphoglycerate dehydrogenase [Candidatus Omnitrophota bacterium]
MKILVSDPLAAEGLAVLRSRGLDVDARANIPADELKRIIGEYGALIVRSETKVTADLIAAGKKLKVIGRAGVGVDNVDVEAATKKGVVVMNTPGGNTISTAEHTVSMLLSLNRNIPQANASMKAGEWNRKKFKGVELLGKTLGIIGLGRIGIEVAKRAVAFGMKIVAYDPFLSVEKARQLDIELLELSELYKRADYITVHTPLNNETKHMISGKEFALMKKGVKIINCARGGIVDEAALQEAVQQGIVSGAALDVFEEEPPKKELPLLKMESVLTTPHLGASTEEAQINVSVEIAQQVADMLQNKGIRNAVNYPCLASEVCSVLDPYVRFGEKLGRLQSQIITGHIRKVSIKYGGEILKNEVVPITVAILKGLLSSMMGETVNFVNAPMIARERGISVSETKLPETDQVANLI